LQEKEPIEIEPTLCLILQSVDGETVHPYEFVILANFTTLSRLASAYFDATVKLLILWHNLLDVFQKLRVFD